MAEKLKPFDPKSIQVSGANMAKNKIEAYGVKGMESKPWHREFKNVDALNKWAEKNDAEVWGTREPEAVELPLNDDNGNHSEVSK